MVFDTWFDSSISPLYILKYSRDDKFFNKNLPCSLRPQGKEIVRTWLYYTLLKCYLLTKKPIFKEVWINYHIVDEKGRKMSKSEGNIIESKDIITKFGAEPFRLWTAIEGNLTETDFRCSFERIEGASKTINKLWNIARFISQFKKPKKQKLLELDKWIIRELNSLIEFAKNQYEKYDFHNPTTKIKSFVWELLASHYIELAKSRAYNQNNLFSKEEQNAAIYTLHYCLENILCLLAPIIPFVTYKIYFILNKKDIHKEKFPIPGIILSKIKTEDLVQLNSNIWKAKKDNNLSLKAKIKKLTIPEDFKIIENDLKVTHNIENVEYGSKFSILF